MDTLDLRRCASIGELPAAFLPALPLERRPEAFAQLTKAFSDQAEVFLAGSEG